MDKKTLAQFCYFTWIGWIVAFIIYSNQEHKDPFVRFHMRQSLGLGLFALLLLGLLNMAGLSLFEYSPLTLLVLIVLIVIWMYSFNIAMQGKQKPLPLLGGLFQRWFSWL